MLNQVQLIGRAGGDPETMYTQGGTAITKFGLATSEKWKDKQTGEMQERTEWHRLVFFGRVAEIAGEYVKKGGLVYIGGKIHYSEYEKDGVRKFSTEIHCSELRLLGGRRDEEGGERQPSSQRSPAPAPRHSAGYSSTPRPTPPPVDNFDDDEIPF